MLDRTHKKLREAHFFLTAAQEANQSQIFRKEPEALEFYISAFVSAARSVTFAMSMDEGKSTEDWTVDWILRLPNASDRKLMKFFNIQRVKTIHRGAMDIEEVTSTASFIEFAREMSMGGASVSFVTSPPGTPQNTFTKFELKFKGLPDGSPVAYCQRYMALLAELVADFERGHPEPKSGILRKMRRIVRAVRRFPRGF